MTSVYVVYVLVHCLALEAMIYALRPGEGRKEVWAEQVHGGAGGEGSLIRLMVMQINRE